MTAKRHRHNTDFQILHFLVGACHTADAAYTLLCNLRDERKHVVEVNRVPAKLRAQAKLHKAKWKSWSPFKAHRLQAQADFEETKIYEKSNAEALEAAQAELAFIEECIRRLEPHRKYKHLPDVEAHEACQAEEWKLELISRAKNALLTTGAIPTDQFATMQLHPAFRSEILPAIEETRTLLISGPEGYKKVVESLGKPTMGLLEYKNNDL